MRSAAREGAANMRVVRAAGSRRGPRAVFLLLLLLLLCMVRGQEAHKCALPCDCPTDPPACAPGVPTVLDGCSCCLTCARQRGESCSDRMPCDESSALYCDRAAGTEPDFGVCMDLEGDNCVFDGIIYRSGETFQPNCKYHCTCQDGQIGCVPRCNLDLLLPGPDCPFPRKIEDPKECCEQWSCDPKEDADVGDLALAAYRPEATLGTDSSDSSLNCIEQTTEWSACSTSCGMGFSTRVTNKNPACEMVKQTRLCEVRSCEKSQPPDKKGKRCIRTKKSPTAVHLEYKNCTSIQMYKPRYCGVCNDGRCCTPHTTKTIEVEFRCPQGNVKHPVMSITSCVCHANCPQENNAVFRKLS
ncbi:CCN family member 3 [Varanus komodoensis]|uniref:CCN family member 3 n=2 Tax=Varanus komodoensis TaxID=61221 RepID=A0A8D2LRX6_VARKO|nr:CCN family member 3 [Varanus komodoensis]